MDPVADRSALMMAWKSGQVAARGNVHDGRSPALALSRRAYDTRAPVTVILRVAGIPTTTSRHVRLVAGLLTYRGCIRHRYGDLRRTPRARTAGFEGNGRSESG